MLPPIYQIQINNELQGFRRSIFHRLLPVFNNLKEEVRVEREKSLAERAKNFNPDIDDIGTIYEEEYVMEAFRYFDEMQLKQDFLNSTTSRLFHIFEKQIQSIFSTHDFNAQNLEIQIQKEHALNLTNNPNWIKVRDDLRRVSNAIKHGQGKSFTELQNNHPQYLNQYNEIVVTENMLKGFIDDIQNVWDIILPYYVIQ